MRMKILFTRHGESEANIQQIISNRELPHRLTPLGVAQSLGLAEALKKWDVKKVIASPIVRAKDTASIIAGELGIPLQISPALREFDCGIMEGRNDEEAWMAHQEVIRVWDEEQEYGYRILPDGESFNDLKARFLPFLAKVIEENDQDDILLVSHGSMLHQMLPLVLVNVDRVFTKQHPIGNCELVVTQPEKTILMCVEWAGIKLT